MDIKDLRRKNSSTEVRHYSGSFFPGENGSLEELEEMPVIYDINLPFLDEISYNELVSEDHSLEKYLYFFVNSNEEY